MDVRSLAGIPDQDWQNLEQKALDLGLTYNGRPSRSKLIQEIAADRIFISPPMSAEEQGALLRSVVAMHQARAPQSQIEILVAWAIARPEFSEKIKAQFQKLSHFSGWRSEAEKYISQCKPFLLAYKGECWTVEFAKISDSGVGDRRPYLMAWVRELGSNPESDPLGHNRTFLLDAEASVEPIDSLDWRYSGLDEIDMVFEVDFLYRSKPEDFSAESVLANWMGIEKPAIRITRKITSLFWALQELDRYGDKCRIVSPDWAIERSVSTLRNRLRLYGFAD
ncbi:MAG: hypothetical protein HC786_20480 [Richelia sp. CSU_2_1]|nr:hypothetical protein [Richelia sp. CSU_2_1]